MSETADKVRGIMAGKEAAKLAAKPQFTSPDEGRYKIEVDGVASLEIELLRREGHQLKGELTAKCFLAGVKTWSGNVISTSDFNLSAPRTRTSTADYLSECAKTGDSFDWRSLLEELCQSVMAAEKTGKPAQLLSTLPRPTADDVLEIQGFTLPAKHPAILFGDGGTAKSLLALYSAGILAQRGHKVALFDWELSGEDHRDRLERFFGPDMPPIHYVRATRAFVHESERLKRVVRDHHIDYAIFDSIAFACHGKPEDAEVAGAYFQTLRQLGQIGSLHVAHVTKAVEGADMKPFGSVFFHNGARSTWNVKLSDDNEDPKRIAIALHHRKVNLGAKRPSAGFEFYFGPDRTLVRTLDIASVPDLATGLSIRQRMHGALKFGAMTIEQLAEEVDAKQDTVRRTAARNKVKFILLPGGKVGLKDTVHTPPTP